MSSPVDVAAADVATKEGRLFGADFVTKECVAVNVDDRSSKDRETLILNASNFCVEKKR
jgi:hypothetical protein